MSDEPRTITNRTVYTGAKTPVSTDVRDMRRYLGRAPKRFNNDCPTGRCPHRAWVHSIVRDQLEDPDEDQCARCYDCSYEAAQEDDATA